MLPHRIVCRESAEERVGGTWGCGGRGRSYRRRRRRGIRAGFAFRDIDCGSIADGTQGGERHGRVVAGEVDCYAFDLFIGLVCWISTDEFILLELNDDIWPAMDGTNVEASSLDKLYMDLT